MKRWSPSSNSGPSKARPTATGAAAEKPRDQRTAFFEAAKALVPQALEELDKKPLKELDEREQRLLNLALELRPCHHGCGNARQGRSAPRRVSQGDRITRSPADA